MRHKAGKNGAQVPAGLIAVSLHFPERFRARWKTKLQSESEVYREPIAD